VTLTDKYTYADPSYDLIVACNLGKTQHILWLLRYFFIGAYTSICI
jgi:hypothetical protein